MAPVIPAHEVTNEPHVMSDYESRVAYWHDMTVEFLSHIHDQAQKRVRIFARRRGARFQELTGLSEKIASSAATLLDQLSDAARWDDETLRVIWNEATEIGIELQMLRSLESRNAI